MRLGLFGGSFDPVHVGHLQLAVTCRDQAQLDEIRWIPTASQPFKPRGPMASAKDRCAMLAAAIEGEEAMVVSRIELDRTGISYTVDTLRKISESYPDDSLFLLLGSDSLTDLPDWHEPAEICRLALPLVVVRPDQADVDFSILDGILSAERADEVRRYRVDMRPVRVSSTDIRRRVAAGESIDRLVPAEVAQYILKHKLYRTST